MRNLVRSNPRGKQSSSLSYSVEQAQAKTLTDICTKKPYSCRICHKSFQTHSILAAHSANDHPQQQHEYHHHYSSLVTLPPIPRQRETTVSLKTQSRSLGGYTTSVLGHPCPVCQRIFASVHDRDAHLRTAHPQRQTTTQSSTEVDKDICNTYAIANAAKGKRGHSRQNKNNNSTSLSGNVSSKKLSNTKTLRPGAPSSSASSSSKPFQCEVCTRTFSRLSHLTAHEQIHSEVKHFKCSECGKDFLRAASLSEHQRAHAEQK